MTPEEVADAVVRACLRTGGASLVPAIAQAIRAAVEEERARVEALDGLLAQVIQRIESAYRGGIGSPRNTYLPQIGVGEVERWQKARAALSGKGKPLMRGSETLEKALRRMAADPADCSHCGGARRIAEELLR